MKKSMRRVPQKPPELLTLSGETAVLVERAEEIVGETLTAVVT